MARARGVKPPDTMDGAKFQQQQNKTPADFITDPETGKRPNMLQAPNGFIKSVIEHSIDYATLPTREVWKAGKWKNSSDTSSEDYRTWITSGEGTPGNYEFRHYVVPYAVAFDNPPKHPGDWKKSDFEKPKKWGSGSQTKGGSSTAGTLPLGIRFRCPGCGHWWKEMDLAGHAKVCPGNEGGESDWAIECQCCLSLDDTARCKPGFPRPGSPQAKKAEEEKETGT